MRWNILLCAFGLCAFAVLAACSSETAETAADVTLVPDAGEATGGADGVDVPEPTPDPGTPAVDDGPAPDPGPAPDVKPPEPLEPQDPMVCSGTVLEPLQEFGGSCCYTPVSASINGGCNSGAPSTACLVAQCSTELCFRPYCSKTCQMGDDDVNNETGETGPDGITDPGAYDDCAGAVDGPVGTEFRCVSQRLPEQSPLTRCFPGTTFAACDRNADCPDGQGCDLMFIRGGYSKRCRTYPAGSLPGMSACNFDPDAGAMTECQGAYCSSALGCIDGCKDNDDCLTDTCDAGTCTSDGQACETDTDCSAWECDDVQPFGADEAYETTLCQPKNCKTANECPGDDWFCRPFWNGSDAVDEVGLAHACRPAPSGAVQYGEACDADSPCVFGSSCIDGLCAPPCTSDTDCGETGECLQAFEWSIDVDDDDETDTWVNIDLCIAWPAADPASACTADADCAEGEHCQYRMKGTGDDLERVWTVEYRCRIDQSETMGAFGEVCGADGNGLACKSDLCLVPNLLVDDAPAYCADYCQSAADCPEQMGPWGGLYWKTVCQSFRVDHNNTPGTEDDLFVPYCRPTNSTSSLKSCEETRTCASGKEFCRALAIAGNPDEPVTVEHLCSDASEGLPSVGVLVSPTKRVGEPCESWTECVGRRCLANGEGTSYCSELCLTDDDCFSDDTPGLECTTEVLIARAAPENSGITKRCVLVQPCVPCAEDADCGGDHVCVNNGGLGFLEDKRCGATCIEDADCDDPETTCREDVDAGTGLLTGKKACLPDICQ